MTNAENSTTPTVEPFAFMRFTHEAERVGIARCVRLADELAGHPAQETLAALAAAFEDVARCIDIHARQENDGLLPLLDRRHDGVCTREGIFDEHDDEKAQHAAIRARLRAARDLLDASSAAAVRDAVKRWADSSLEHIEHEERVMLPLVLKLGPLQERASIVHDLIDVGGRVEAEDWQMPWVARQLESHVLFDPLRGFVAALQGSHSVGESVIDCTAVDGVRAACLEMASGSSVNNLTVVGDTPDTSEGTFGVEITSRATATGVLSEGHSIGFRVAGLSGGATVDGTLQGNVALGNFRGIAIENMSAFNDVQIHANVAENLIEGAVVQGLAVSLFAKRGDAHVHSSGNLQVSNGNPADGVALIILGGNGQFSNVVDNRVFYTSQRDTICAAPRRAVQLFGGLGNAERNLIDARFTHLSLAGAGDRYFTIDGGVSYDVFGGQALDNTVRVLLNHTAVNGAEGRASGYLNDFFVPPLGPGNNQVDFRGSQNSFEILNCDEDYNCPPAEDLF